jgi:hypothetical protein
MIVPICLRLKKSQPLTVLGIAFFFIGHSLESTFIPLEIIHEHRNYFPMIGILLAVTVPLLSSTASFGALKIRIIFVCLMIILFAFCTYMRSLDWSTEYNLWSSEVRHHEFSMRSKGELAKMYANALTNNPTQKIEFDELAHQSFEQILFFDANNTMALFGLIQLHRYDAERFQQRWLLDLETGLRQKALPANTNDQLTTMAQCIVSKECQFDESNINMIMVAALKNSHVIGRDRALIYNAIVFYKYNITHDYVGALEAAKEAITLDSDVEHQFWMAKILLKMSNPIEAKNQIDKIKKMNLSIVRSDEILDMEAQLNAMK